jgi:hypothetical protein
MVAKHRRSYIPKETKKSFRKTRAYKRVVFSLATVLWVVSFVLFCRASFMQITQVRVAEGIYSKEISSLVEGILREKYLWLIPKTNILFIPRGHLTREITVALPRIESVQIELDGRVLSIAPVDRIPVALYCADTDPNSPCFFIDKEARLFSSAPYYGSGYVIFRDTTSTSTKQLLDIIENEVVFSRLMTFTQESLASGLEPRYATRVDSEDYVIEFTNGVKARIRPTKDLSATLEYLRAVLANKKFNEANGETRIDSVDLVLGSKVFVRLREGGVVRATSTRQ